MMYEAPAIYVLVWLGITATRCVCVEHYMYGVYEMSNLVVGRKTYPVHITAVARATIV